MGKEFGEDTKDHQESLAADWAVEFGGQAKSNKLYQHHALPQTEVNNEDN